ncbi:uncharacterized protein [Amphiura filiformis]|uniref:uncharacterized protein n=1 Tax=Amphiura filiformis TaxID=82378 RepID=UPI003B21C0EE
MSAQAPMYREIHANGKVRVDHSKSSFGSLSQVAEATRVLLLHPNEIGKCRENPLTHKGKRIQLTKMLILILIPIFSLAILAVLDLNTIARNNSVNVEVRNAIRFSRDIGVLLSRLQRERDMTALYVSAIGAENNVYLTETYPLTDLALDELKYWPVETSVLKELPFFRKKSDFKQHLAYHRNNLNRNDTTVYQEIDFYTGVLQIFIDWLYESVGNSKGHATWQTLVAYQLLIVSNVDTGIERTLGSVFYAQGKFHRHEDYVWYLDKYNVGAWNFNASKRYSTLAIEFYEKGVANLSEDFIQTITEMRTTIREYGSVTNVEYATLKPSFGDATIWFDSMTAYVNILENVQKEMAEEILARLENDLQSDTKSIAVSIALVIVVIVMCPLILRAFWAITTDIQNYALTLASQTKALNKEKKRADWLLYSMMPIVVAEQLMTSQDVTAEYFDSATVFFADITGFSKLCSESTPMQIVEMLNGLYLVFDTRIEHYNVYKVETINETYMLASGLPTRCGTRHVGEIATVALDLVYHASCLEVPHKKHKKIQIRVGINTGSVVAGVVGLKMPRYCLFGDTVNTASRMQSTGLPGRVQVSDTSYLGLMDLGGYKLVKRGIVDVKGKGSMDTYWLTEKDNFEMAITAEDNANNLMNDVALREHKYEHMYEQTYTGRIQYRGRTSDRNGSETDSE